jgi:hypothetical protein
MDGSTEPGPAAASGALAGPDAAEALATGRRFRGKNKNGRWKREEGTELAVIRLPLDVHPDDEPHLEQLFSTMWDVKRTLQRDARNAVDAYWAGTTRREADAKAWRRELGLTREGMERRAYAHMERSGWFGHHVSKALVMHQADEVFETAVARHLFPDASGRRHGRPKTGTWWDCTRIPGRARFHTSERTWETFRLHGTLDGHLAAHRHPRLDQTATTPDQAALLPAGTGVLAQPWRLQRPERPAGRIPTGASSAKGRPKTRAATWWDHTGPLTVVFAGGPDGRKGDLVLPVRLPSGAGRWARLVHFLGRPQAWHKIDLVRRRDASVPRGWAYEAHLMVLTGGYASPSPRASSPTGPGGPSSRSRDRTRRPLPPGRRPVRTAQRGLRPPQVLGVRFEADRAGAVREDREVPDPKVDADHGAGPACLAAAALDLHLQRHEPVPVRLPAHRRGQDPGPAVGQAAPQFTGRLVRADRPQSRQGHMPAIRLHPDGAGREPARQARLRPLLEPRETHFGALSSAGAGFMPVLQRRGGVRQAGAAGLLRVPIPPV